MNRRKFLKSTFGGLLSIIGVSGGIYYYAREIEPATLRTIHETILSDIIPNKFHNFKIIQFSDTHLGFQYTLKQLNELVTRINRQNPDLVVFTGDLIDQPQTFHSFHKLTEILQSIKATYGKFWVYGNHDHGGSGTNIIRDIMNKAGFQLLNNEHSVIEINNERLILSGVDDKIFGTPNIETALKDVNPDLFTILLAHEPDYADVTRNYPVHIQLSGHSHGGQVRLPFIGHLYTPKFAEKYIQGKYVFKNEELSLYVNKGVGTTRLPFRFLCKPEIHSFTLKRVGE